MPGPADAAVIEPPKSRLTPRQDELWRIVKATPDEGISVVGYGGAMGGGKTRALAELALETALTFPGTRLLVARRNYTDLQTTTLEAFYEACPPDLIVERRRTAPESCVLHATGWPQRARSTVYFRHLGDWTGIGSEQYGAVFIDEAGEVPEQAVLMLLTRLRHPAQRQRFLVAASNPWPGWFERWFTRGELPAQTLAAAGGRLAFVQARIADNPYLPPNYEALQRALLPGPWVDRFIDGRFDAFMGQVYDTFDPALHRWDGDLPPFRKYVGGLDFGGQNPWDHKTAGLIAGMTAPGAHCGPDKLVRIAEFEAAGPGVYEDLLAWIRGWEQQLRRPVAWRADKTQGPWIDRMRREGLLLRPSHGGPESVSLGIGLVQSRFRIGDDGQPGSFYLSRLTAFPERMRGYRWEQPRDDDSPVRPHPVKRDDDLMDADRYMHEEADGFPSPSPQPRNTVIQFGQRASGRVHPWRRDPPESFGNRPAPRG